MVILDYTTLYVIIKTRNVLSYSLNYPENNFIMTVGNGITYGKAKSVGTSALQSKLSISWFGFRLSYYKNPKGKPIED